MLANIKYKMYVIKSKIKGKIIGIINTINLHIHLFIHKYVYIYMYNRQAVNTYICIKQSYNNFNLHDYFLIYF